MTLLPNIPRKEDDIEKYCEALLEIMNSHEEDLLVLAPQIAELNSLLERYRHDKDLQAKAQAIYQEATNSKLKQIEDMTSVMRICRKYANKLPVPAKSDFIDKVSVGDRYSLPPADPRNLTFQILEPGEILLQWQKPKKGTGGPVSVTEIQVRYAEEERWNILETTDGNTHSMTISISGRNQIMAFRISVKNQVGTCPNGSNVVRVIV